MKNCVTNTNHHAFIHTEDGIYYLDLSKGKRRLIDDNNWSLSKICFPVISFSDEMKKRYSTAMLT